jgi:chromosome segregation ATPase
MAQTDITEREEAGNTKRRVSAMSQEIAAARRGLDRYFAAFEEASLSPADCRERIAQLKSRIDALEAEEASLTHDGGEDASEPPTAEDIAGWAAELRGTARRGLSAEAQGAPAQVHQELKVRAAAGRAHLQSPGAGSRTGTAHRDITWS